MYGGLSSCDRGSGPSCGLWGREKGYIMALIVFKGFHSHDSPSHSPLHSLRRRWYQSILKSEIRDEMASHSRSSYATWLALFVSSFGSTACSYVSVITATTFAQPSFVYEKKTFSPSFRYGHC